MCLEGEFSVTEAGDNQRSSMSSAMRWVSQITTASFMMALPALGGYWLDHTWRTGPWFLVAGAVLGFIVSFSHLLQMTGALKGSPKKDAGKQSRRK